MIRFTQRELQVLQGYADGKDPGQLGAELYITPNTIKEHRKKIYARLNTNCMAHAVAEAMRLGVIS